MRPERGAMYVVGAGLVIAALVWLVSARSPATETTVTPTSTRATASPVPSTFSVATASATSTAITPPAATPITTPTPALPFLPTPQQAVRTQIELLVSDRIPELRATFTPAARDELTPDAVAFCKQKVKSHPVLPDWETAEDGVTDAGERVRRVSMFGKSMTGFVEVAPGRWLADSVWCLQGRGP